MAKSTLVRAVALATMLVLFLTSTAFAANWEADTRLTIKVKPGRRVEEGTELVVKGKLKSARVWCVRDSRVTLRRYNHGVLARTRTDNQGRYRFEIVARHDMQIRVWFRGKERGVHPNHHVCLKSRSKTVKINVT